MSAHGDGAPCLEVRAEILCYGFGLQTQRVAAEVDAAVGLGGRRCSGVGCVDDAGAFELGFGGDYELVSEGGCIVVEMLGEVEGLCVLRPGDFLPVPELVDGLVGVHCDVIWD